MSIPLFSSGGTYQVRALVNGNSLESCSIIRQDDKITPYFVVSVANDPDLMGLLVYLQNSKGDIIGERVLYTIDPVDEAVLPQTSQEETKLVPQPSPKGIEPEVRGSLLEDNDSEGKELEASGKEETETAGQAESESPKQVTEKRPSVDTKSALKKYDTVILIKSFKQEMPCFPLPKNMEIGSYSLVFEAVGRSSTLSLTEADIFYLGNVEFRLNDISMYLPWLSDTRLIPPGATVMLEAGLDFDSRLNPYVIWYNGRNIISEGSISNGAGNILWKAPEQSGFYSLRAEVLPYRLKRNLAGFSREITLPVSAKASQTGFFFGNGPDFSAKRPLAAGTVYAEQVQLTADLTVNAERTAITPIPPEHPELLRWYRFDGSLDEASLIPERVFEPAGEKVPRWGAVGQSYGLSAGSDDVYLLRPIRFFRRGQDQGGGIFLFYIRPVAEGTIFSAFFPTFASASALAPASDGVWMDMVTRENAITLRLKTKGTSVEMPVNSGYSEEQGLIPIVVEFYIRPYRFEAKLSLGEDISMQSVTGEIRLPGALAGEGRIKLGVDKTAPAPIVRDIPIETVQAETINNENKTSSATATATTAAAATTVTAVTTVTALTTIWDEFAVLYSTTPLLPEEIFIEDNDSDSGETEAAQNRETPIRTPAAAVEPQKETRASLPPAEKAKPNSVDTGASHENEAPLADIQADNILIIEQEPAETEDEEASSLISIP
jgi:hypothetical protein